ncbi:Porin B [Phycisphaerales bacterium]|nr:Porin B [Phycisphaerales bacterium]
MALRTSLPMIALAASTACGQPTAAPAENSESTAEEAPREWFGGKPWSEWERATGDWAGARTKLEEHGLTIGASYTVHWSSVWSGGLRNVASSRHLFDLNAALDTETAFGLKGGTFYADFYAASMRGGSRDVNDWQWFSMLETGRNGGQLAEVWYQHEFAEGTFRVKVGKIDAYYEFALPEQADDFLHSSAYTPPTIMGLPTYPDPAMGVLGFAYPSERWYVGAGVFDGALLDGIPTGNRAPDTAFEDDLSASWFFIGEAGVRWSEAAGMGGGRFAVGAHHSTAQVAAYDGSVNDGSFGVYALAEQQFWSPARAGEDSDRGLYGFGQVSWCDSGDVTCHAAAGVVWRGPCPSRDSDSTGMYVSWIDLTDEEGTPYPDNETAIELYYKIVLTPSMSITPDLQVIINPSGDPSINDAVVGQLEFEVLF